MPRFVNTETGSVVSVSDEQAESLGREYEPHDEKAPAKKPASKSSQK